MKLKKFLLRYDPPGIGLEIESLEGDQKQVLHKDLPPIKGVSSIKDIMNVVDWLIAEESQLLSKKRHKPALVQLLGRLYQVDVETAPDDDDPAPAQADEQDKLGDQFGDFPSQLIDKEVVLIGLTGKSQVHNGELAVVKKVREDRHLDNVWVAQVEIHQRSVHNAKENDTLKVKGIEHLVPVAARQPGVQGTGLAVGTHVAIRGLRNHIELNGCLGRVVECHEETHRFEVRATESGQLFRVKQENLIPIDPFQGLPCGVGASKENHEPNTSPRQKHAPAASSSAPAPGDVGDEDGAFEVGSTVTLFGLKTAMNYNGQTAEVLSVDRARSRYEIRLADGSVKTIRAENVRLVSGASKTSPRTRRKDAPRKA